MSEGMILKFRGNVIVDIETNERVDIETEGKFNNEMKCAEIRNLLVINPINKAVNFCKENNLNIKKIKTRSIYNGGSRS